MKKSIDTYVKAVALDESEFIESTVANHLIAGAEAGAGWSWYFDDDELESPECEPTDEQIGEVKDYLKKYWDITVEEIY